MDYLNQTGIYFPYLTAIGWFPGYSGTMILSCYYPIGWAFKTGY